MNTEGIIKTTMFSPLNLNMFKDKCRKKNYKNNEKKLKPAIQHHLNHTETKDAETVRRRNLKIVRLLKLEANFRISITMQSVHAKFTINSHVTPL